MIVCRGTDYWDEDFSSFRSSITITFHDADALTFILNIDCRRFTDYLYPINITEFGCIYYLAILILILFDGKQFKQLPRLYFIVGFFQHHVQFGKIVLAE